MEGETAEQPSLLEKLQNELNNVSYFRNRYEMIAKAKIVVLTGWYTKTPEIVRFQAFFSLFQVERGLGKSSCRGFEHQIVYPVLSFRNRSVWYSINKASQRSSFSGMRRDAFGLSLFTVTQLLLQFKPLSDPTQPCRVFFDVVHLRDLRRGMPKEIRHLPRRQGLDRAIRLLDAVH